MEKCGEEEWTGVRQAWGNENNIWVCGGIFFGVTLMKSFFADFGQRGTYVYK
jgi:hypothetical protein